MGQDMGEAWPAGIPEKKNCLPQWKRDTAVCRVWGVCPALPSSGLYPVSSTGQVFPRIVLGPASFGLDTWNLGARTSLRHPSIYLNLGYNEVSCTGPPVGSVPVGPFSSSVCELDARARTAGDKELDFRCSCLRSLSPDSQILKLSPTPS